MEKPSEAHFHATPVEVNKYVEYLEGMLKQANNVYDASIAAREQYISILRIERTSLFAAVDEIMEDR